MGTNQGDRQAAVRALTGTVYNYEGDWHALFDLVGIASGDFNGRMLAWLNQTMAASYPDLPGAQAAFALSQGADTWNGLGTFSTWQTPGAVLDYDFKNNRYLGPALTTSRASPAYIDDSAGNWTFVPANTLRRSDKGALIEGAQTNLIKNNSGQGAVAGVLGSGGSLSTGWLYNLSSSAGITLTSLGPMTRNGIDGFGLRVSGTLTGTAPPQLFPTPTTDNAAVQGNLFTHSMFCALIAGSMPAGAQSIYAAIEEWATGPTYLAGSSAPLTPIAALSRAFANRTLTNANVAYAKPVINLTTAPAGTATDYTLFVGGGQFERWDTSITTVGGASSPIRTTGTAATRAADIVSFNAAAFDGRQGTFAAAVRLGPVIYGSGTVVSLNSTPGTSPIMRVRGSPNETALASAGDNTNFVTTANGVIAPNLRFGYSFAWAQSDAQMAKDGALAGSANGVQNPIQTLTSGIVGAGAAAWGGYIERVALLPTRAPNAQLQTLSTLANWGG